MSTLGLRTLHTMIWDAMVMGKWTDYSDSADTAVHPATRRVAFMILHRSGGCAHSSLAPG